MNLDATFRPYVIAGFFLVILIALPFRIRSQATGEKLDRTQEGVAMMIVLRLGGLALWAGVIAFMIDPAWMAWSSIALPAGARWTGVGLTVLTAALLIWTLRSLGPNLTDTVVTRVSHTLVTRGPYRWVRHPFLRLYGAVRRVDCVDDGELVRDGGRRRHVHAAGDPHAHRGRQAVGAIWRALSRLPCVDGSLPAATAVI